MNILYVVSRPLEFNSSASQRNLLTINALSKLGHYVTVITAEPSKEHSSYSSICLDSNVCQRYIPINAVKRASGKFEQHKFLKKIKKTVYRIYNKGAIYDSWKSLVESDMWEKLDYTKFDLLITSADPKSSHLIGEKIVDNHELRWIQIWGDPFTGDITSSGTNESKKRKEENRLFSKADKVEFLSEMTCEDMKINYPEYRNKFYFMPRPYIEEKIYPLPNLPIEYLSLSYCGDYHSGVRNIIPLYEAVSEGKDKLTICGNTDLKLEQTDRISVFPRVSADRVTQIEDDADVLVHLSNLSGGQIPGKIYNYSATNKPVLFILDGDDARIKESFENRRKYYFCNNNKEDIKRALDEIRNGCDFSLLAPAKEFSMQQVIKQLLSGMET